MATFEITGGNRLSGELTPQGAKNEALQILCAALLTPEECIIRNVPNIVDVNKLIELLGDLGVEVNNIGEGDYSFKATNVNIDYLNSPEFKEKGGSQENRLLQC